MIRIAVVDDDSIYISKIEKYFSDYLINNSIEYELNTFLNGVELMESVKKSIYDILVLDIDMPEISGIDIAKYIRKMNNDITIIFVTNMDNLVFESIKYAPFRFIRKQRMESEMPELLDAIKERYSKEDITYNFISNGEETSVKIKDIIYFESFDHDIFMRMSDKGEYKISDTLNSISDKFGAMGFIRIHKSYIVNFRYIFEFKRASIILDDKTELPVSKNRVTEIKREYAYFTRKELE